MISQTGFLLSYLKYGDHDAVLRCFTKESGYQAYFLRGLYAQKNKKKAYLQPLNELQISVSAHATAAMPAISRIEPAGNFIINDDIKTASVLFFVADFLNQILHEEAQNPEIYHEIGLFLTQMAAGNYSAHLVLLIKIIGLQGFLPLVTGAPYLDPETGNFTGERSPRHFDTEISEKWKETAQSRDAFPVRFPAGIRKAFLDSIMTYCHYHYANFRIPPSLEVVRDLFD